LLVGGSPLAANFEVNYVIMDDTDSVVASVHGTNLTTIQVAVKFDRLDNFADAVRAAIQENEGDPDLQVQVL